MSLPIRHVILPWTQPLMVTDTSTLPAVLDIREDRLVKVAASSESAALHHTSQPTGEPTTNTASAPNPWHQLMQLDAPIIPDEHRIMLDEDSLIGATVVLDVFTTLSHRINEEDTILSDVAGLLLDTVGAVQGDHADLEDLAEILVESEGNLRQAMGEQLQAGAVTRCAQAVPAPASVANAIQAIEAMSEIAIREATLIIDGQPLIETTQI